MLRKSKLITPGQESLREQKRAQTSRFIGACLPWSHSQKQTTERKNDKIPFIPLSHQARIANSDSGTRPFFILQRALMPDDS
jgi:hypothetical protein